jgi:hypothetical protein
MFSQAFLGLLSLTVSLGAYAVLLPAARELVGVV